MIDALILWRAEQGYPTRYWSITPRKDYYPQRDLKNKKRCPFHPVNKMHIDMQYSEVHYTYLYTINNNRTCRRGVCRVQYVFL